MIRRLSFHFPFSPLLFLSVFGFFILAGIFFQSTPAQAFTIGKSNVVNNLGLVGYWTFDGKDISNGAILDKSGNGNTGYALSIASSTFYTAGEIGQAGNFDGVNDYINTGIASSLQITGPITICSWAKTSTITIQSIVGNRNFGAGYTFALFSTTDGRGKFTYFGITDWSSSVGYSLADGSWHNYCVVNPTSGNISFYRDGVLHSTAGAAAGGVLNSSRSNYIGSLNNSGTASGFFGGSLDDVRIYNRALSASEVNALYQQGNAKQNASQNLKMNSGLVGAWSFDGKDMPNGRLTDLSGNGNTGSLASVATSSFRVPGAIGQAGNFDGVDDHVVLPATVKVGNSDFSASFWVKFTTTNRGEIFSEGNTVSLPPFLLIEINGLLQTAGTVSIRSRDDTGNVSVYTTSTKVINDNQWHHVTFTQTGTSPSIIRKVYIDGILDTTSSSITFSTATFNSYRLGTLQNNSTVEQLPLNASLDDLRIYNRALSQSEITELYRTGTAKTNASQNTQLTTGLVGAWSFDGKDMPAGHVNDVSGNGNTGYMISMSTTSARVPGKIGQALNFDGVDDFVRIPNSAALKITGDMTIGFWVNIANNANFNGLVSKQASTGNGEYEVGADFRFGGASFTWRSTNSGTITNLASFYSGFTNQWVYVTAVVNGTTVSAYRNGTLFGTITNIGTRSSTSFNLNLGDRTDNGGFNINGKLDDVRIYNRALSASEVMQLYSLSR